MRASLFYTYNCIEVAFNVELGIMLVPFGLSGIITK